MLKEKKLVGMGGLIFWMLYFLCLFPLLLLIIPCIKIFTEYDIPLVKLLFNTPILFVLVITIISILTGYLIIKKKRIAISLAKTTFVLTLLLLFYSYSKKNNFRVTMGAELWFIIQIYGLYYFSNSRRVSTTLRISKKYDFSNYVKCPHCDEFIEKTAAICEHCKSKIIKKRRKSDV